jgi:hypothetical protein
MFSRIQFAQRIFVAGRRRGIRRAALLLTAFLVLPILSRAQDAPSGTIGRVDGNDISVDSGTPAGRGTATIAPSIYVLNGSVVTVHSGTAHLTFVAGGQIDICGPAKFTLLQSSNAVTLALNFGRMRVQLPSTTALRVFTPTIIATPLDIGGEPRDVTFGLDLNDSLCVLATTGAIRLEHQFTGETLVVPQAGQFFLANGKLVPVAGGPGGCQCDVTQTHVTPVQPEPQMGLAAPAVTVQPPATPSTELPAEEPPVEYSIPAHANETHPIAPPPMKTNPNPEPPPDAQPVYKVVMPPLTFSADAPTPPSGPSTDMILLVRVAHVEPDWTFTGHVEAPRVEKINQPSPAPHAQTQPPQTPGKKGGGFWSKLKRIFVGS